MCCRGTPVTSQRVYGTCCWGLGWGRWGLQNALLCWASFEAEVRAARRRQQRTSKCSLSSYGYCIVVSQCHSAHSCALHFLDQITTFKIFRGAHSPPQQSDTFTRTIASTSAPQQHRCTRTHHPNRYLCFQSSMEVVTEEQPRIKFQCQRQGDCEPLYLDTPGLQDLIKLCQRMEELGAAPVLNDGLVGGNAGILVVSEGSGVLLHRQPAQITSTHAVPPLPPLPQDAPGISSSGPTLFVTRSGKPPALHMGPGDFVAVTGFCEAAWSATYRYAAAVWCCGASSVVLWCGCEMVQPSRD